MYNIQVRVLHKTMFSKTLLPLYIYIYTYVYLYFVYMWKFAYHAVLSSRNWPAGRRNTEASARVEDDVYVLRTVYRCYWALHFYYLYRKITAVIIISNYGHYNYRPSTFITYCLRVRRTYIEVITPCGEIN